MGGSKGESAAARKKGHTYRRESVRELILSEWKGTRRHRQPVLVESGVWKQRQMCKVNASELMTKNVLLWTWNSPLWCC
jgi:hypothetical protein